MAVSPHNKCERSDEIASSRSLRRSAFLPMHADENQGFKKADERLTKVNKKTYMVKQRSC